jgi:hypothetical protein
LRALFSSATEANEKPITIMDRRTSK